MYINVNGIRWGIVMVHSRSELLRRSDGIITLGVTDCNTFEVYLCNELENGLLYNVLCHEICHVFVFSYGYYMTIEEEERLAQFIADFGRQIVDGTDSIIKNLIKRMAS